MADRKSGILLHPTSLPGVGVGDLGAGAERFIEWLAAAGQRVWQVLPLAPTGYGDSPYQALSSFAGNPLLISLERLHQQGLLSAADLATHPGGSSSAASAASVPDNEVQYERVIPWKSRLLDAAAKRFLQDSDAVPDVRGAFDEFVVRHHGWLEDYALFMALKQAHDGAPWPLWDPPLAHREPAALEAARTRLGEALHAHRFAQFAFFEQWARCRTMCRERGIEIVGDLPIYVAHDSAEVWSHPELFRLDSSGTPTAVAGVPPDYFSSTGQLWGNPLYAWDVHERTGFSWWIERMRAALELVDRVRLDHFRGFEAYWEIPARERTAMNGRWVKAPGEKLFAALERALGKLPIIAENLGVITPEVEALRHRFGFPGMAILQFAFGNDPQADTFKPHNYSRDLAAYTGTHDNDTVIGWWTSGAADSTRTLEEVEREKSFARAYLGTDGREMNWVMIRWLLASVAETAVIPMQDVLGLGSEARMNRPSTAGGNWRWWMRNAELSRDLAGRLRELTAVYGR